MGNDFTTTPLVPTPAGPIPANPIVYVTNIAGQQDVFARLDSGEYSVTTAGELVARTTADIADFLILLSDAATAGTYMGAVPTGTPAGRYSINIFQPSATAPAGYALVGADYARFDWNGFSETPAYSVNVTATPYNVVQDLYAEMGQYNAELAGNPDNVQDAATLAFHMQWSLDGAAAQFNREARKRGYDTPLTASLADLRRIGAKLAAYELWQIRGLQRAVPDIDFLAKKLDGERELAGLFWMNAGGFTSTTVMSDGMASARPAVGPDGLPIVTSPHRPYWDGVRWIGTMLPI